MVKRGVGLGTTSDRGSAAGRQRAGLDDPDGLPAAALADGLSRLVAGAATTSTLWTWDHRLEELNAPLGDSCRPFWNASAPTRSDILRLCFLW